MARIETFICGVGLAAFPNAKHHPTPNLKHVQGQGLFQPLLSKYASRAEMAVFPNCPCEMLKKITHKPQPVFCSV